MSSRKKDQAPSYQRKAPARLYSREEIKEYCTQDRVLGTGSFSTVFKGEGEAIKLYNMCKNRSNKSQMAHQFEVEKHALEILNHPNIIGLRGYVEEDGDECAGIIMELGDKTLQEAFSGLNWLQTLKVLHEVAEALKYMHNHPGGPFLFVDLKPNNILLKENGIKICDFGGVIIGESGDPENKTLEYGAPEFLEGGKATKLSDVYSFGVLILQLVLRPSSLLGLEKQKRRGKYERKKKEHIAQLIRYDKNACKIDRKLKEDKNRTDFQEKCIIELAKECTEDFEKKRPTMDTVVHDLTELLADE